MLLHIVVRTRLVKGCLSILIEIWAVWGEVSVSKRELLLEFLIEVHVVLRLHLLLVGIVLELMLWHGEVI